MSLADFATLASQFLLDFISGDNKELRGRDDQPLSPQMSFLEWRIYLSRLAESEIWSVSSLKEDTTIPLSTTPIRRGAIPASAEGENRTSNRPRPDFGPGRSSGPCESEIEAPRFRERSDAQFSDFSHRSSYSNKRNFGRQPARRNQKDKFARSEPLASLAGAD